MDSSLPTDTTALSATGVDAVSMDATSVAAVTELLDQVDAEYRQAPERFPVLNEDRLGDKP